LIPGSQTVNVYGNGTKCCLVIEERIYNTFDDGTLEPPFNVPKCMVLPHVTFIFSDLKSVISLLNYLHLRVA
jgi:hypothetical protein